MTTPQQKNGTALHPRTGKPIKIMTLETQLHKDQKTLLWARTSVETADKRWKTVSCGPEDIGANYRIYDGKIWLLKGQDLNLAGLEEAYPFLGGKWDGTDEDAVLLLAGLLRFQRIAGFPGGPQGPAAGRADLLRALGVEFLAAGCQPEPLWLIQQFYQPSKERRAREIRKCLVKNLAQPWIDRVVLLNEKAAASELPASDKLEEVVIGHRLIYKDVIEYICEKVPAGVRVAFSNSDIWLADWDAAGFWTLDMHNKFLALLRYEADTGAIFGPRADSQDCWVVMSDSVKSKKWDLAALNFPFGQMGCDNSITTEFLRQKFSVANPCLTLKTMHEHASQVRTYEKTDVVQKQIFVYVEPSGIHDMAIEKDLTPFASPALADGEATRQLRSANEAGLKTWVTMMNKRPGEAWSLESANMWKDPKERDYKMSRACVTNTGLLYDYDTLYLGNTPGAKEAWSAVELHPLTPLEECESMLAVPFDGNEQLADYSGGGFMKYLARVLGIWKRGARGDFWVEGESAVAWLRLFEWGTLNVPVMAWNETGAAYAGEVWWTGTRKAGAPLYKRDVDVLRKALKGWTATAAGSKLIGWGAAPWFSLAEGEWHGLELAEENVTWVHSSTHSPQEICEALIGASELYMRSADACPFLWMLPIGARIVEVQNEMEPAAGGLHTAGVCGLEHWFVFEPRALPAAAEATVQRGIVETRAGWKRKVVNSSASAKPNLPVLIMPDCGTTGFYGHAGDTFRELAGLWEKAGYVRIVRDSRATLCWLNAIGDVLLYDRPTLDWLERATLAEKNWRVGLFGNPAAPGGGRPWTFWSRRPAMLEGRSPLAWEERKRGLVFYGKCENAIQAARREGSWTEMCDEFSMDAPYSQKEYLDRLAEARWGLCLPGFGWKCNREIECLALGVVPVCAAGVDMDNYAEPLVEGEHYIRLVGADAGWQEPDEATWRRMSAAGRAWWERNCSVAGSWEVTRRATGLV